MIAFSIGKSFHLKSMYSKKMWDICRLGLYGVAFHPETPSGILVFKFHLQLRVLSAIFYFISKIINSIAKKYDCQVKFDHESETVASNCEEHNKPHILAEVMGIFGVN